MGQAGSIFEHWFVAVCPELAEATVSEPPEQTEWDLFLAGQPLACQERWWAPHNGTILRAALPHFCSSGESGWFTLPALTPVESHQGCPPSQATSELSGKLSGLHAWSHWPPGCRRIRKRPKPRLFQGARQWGEHRQGRISTRRWRQASPGPSREAKTSDPALWGQRNPPSGLLPDTHSGGTSGNATWSREEAGRVGLGTLARALPTPLGSDFKAAVKVCQEIMISAIDSTHHKLPSQWTNKLLDIVGWKSDPPYLSKLSSVLQGMRSSNPTVPKVPGQETQLHLASILRFWGWKRRASCPQCGSCRSGCGYQLMMHTARILA